MRKHFIIFSLLLYALCTIPAIAGLYVDGIPQGVSGGGTGAVSSVNGQTGTVTLTQDNIGSGTTYKQYSATEKAKVAAIVTNGAGTQYLANDGTYKTVSGGGGSGSVNTVNSVGADGAGNVSLTQDNIPDGTINKAYTATEKTKLAAITGTNTGDETASTIINKIGDGSKINSNYLPSYVDDVLEFANVASFPATGEVGKIYIALDVNLTYRWDGSGYIEISPSIALGETSATAYRGDRGASAYAHSILTGGTNPHNTTFANIASKPTTVAGYGITDGVTLAGTETLTNKTLANPVFTGNLDTTAYSAVIRSGSGETVFKNTGNLQFGQIGSGGISVGSYEKSAFAQFNGTAAAVQMKFANNTTGKSATDAFDVGILADGTAEIRQRENKPLDVYTNNVLAATFGVDKSLTLPSLAGTGQRGIVAGDDGKLGVTGGDFIFSNTGLTSTPQSTGISINGGLCGKIVMAYLSGQWDGGNATSSAIIMIRCGYNGNILSSTVISSDNYIYPVTFTQVSGTLYVSAALVQGVRIRFITN